MILRHQHNFIHGCDCCCCNLDPLLFDLFPGAAAGYSVRRLSSTYEGAAMQVRRSSDNTTLDIGFVGEDLDTAALLAFAGVGSAFVSIWYDQSGFGRNAVQATTANQPRIVNAGVLDVEGIMPTLFFDGTDDRLVIPNIGTNTQPFTILRVFRGITTGTTSAFIESTGVLVRLYSTSATASRMNAGVLYTLGTGPISSYQSTHNFFNGASSYQYWNGVDSALGNPGANSLTGSVYIGSGSSELTFRSLVQQELIIYPTNQSANRVSIEANINAYYNIY